MRKFVMLGPDNLERKYRRRLRLIVGTMGKELQDKIKYIFSRKDDLEEQESQKEEIAALIALLLLWLQNQQYDFSVFTRSLFREINAFNDKQFRKMVKSTTGLTILPSQSLPFSLGETYSPSNEVMNVFGNDADINRVDRFLPIVESTWLDNQLNQLNKELNGVITDSSNVLNTAVLAATGLKTVRETIAKIIIAVTNRLERFAIDQVNTVDSLLNQYRQTGLFIKEYVWQTRLDERVRGNPAGKYPKSKPSHWEREGKIFNWNNPPLGGHPGEAPGCRCRAIMRAPRKSP